MTSLLKRNQPLANTAYQLEILENKAGNYSSIPSFREKLSSVGLYPLKPNDIEIFQMNLGKMCNQTCKHCHVDAGPDRKEIMTRQTMEQCLEVLKNGSMSTVDLTGGAPEMNPHFRWLVEECINLGKKVMVRCNLTIIVANKKYFDLPLFYSSNKVEVVSSLPFYNADRTDRQRGKGVFEDSVKAIKMLNEVGYGKQADLILNLVYNPTGAFLPADQQTLERQFKKVLTEEFGVEFNHLFAITNMPISRFLEFLLDSGNYEGYMEKLSNLFNPAAAKGVMCRNTLSIGWNGFIYDCDFNQMLDLKVEGQSQHVSEFDIEELNKRNIVLNQHCYGCTAGAGSSCGGNTV